MFDKKSRKIFRFFDGSRQRGIDPMEADIALQSVDLDWEATFLTLRIGLSPDATKEQREEVGAASAAIIDATRKAFKIKEFEILDDGSEVGLTTVEVLDLLGEFREWRATLENFTDPPATLPQSTADTPPVTGSGTDSISTSPAKSPETVSP